MNAVPFRFSREETRLLEELSAKMSSLSRKRGPGWQREWILAWRHAGRIVNNAIGKYHTEELKRVQVELETQ